MAHLDRTPCAQGPVHGPACTGASLQQGDQEYGAKLAAAGVGCSSGCSMQAITRPAGQPGLCHKRHILALSRNKAALVPLRAGTRFRMDFGCAAMQLTSAPGDPAAPPTSRLFFPKVPIGIAFLSILPLLSTSWLCRLAAWMAASTGFEDSAPCVLLTDIVRE